MTINDLQARIDFTHGRIEGVPALERRLQDLRGCFADVAAWQTEVSKDNRLVYRVCSVEPALGAGQMHYGLGVIMPGRVGREYHLTKGHLHSWRDAAEIYLHLRGEGLMLLEHEDSGESRLLPLSSGCVVYVPGRTAHRTINTGPSSFMYLGIYPAGAGHDYGWIASRNFRKVVIEQDGRPVMVDREELGL